MLWFACTTVVALAGLYVLLPLFKEPKGNPDIDLLAETEFDRLLDRKSVLYGNLKDLKFEYTLGRLSDTDFRQLEAGYKNEASAILQKLDRLEASDKLDSLIEKDIASRKARIYASVSKPERDPSRCPSCGAEVIAGKRFCADCGYRL
jgi:predicted Zn-ribbon and HTH transcriptional regulator